MGRSSWVYQVLKVVNLIVIASMLVTSASPVVAASAPAVAVPNVASPTQKESASNSSFPEPVADAVNALAPSAFASSPSLSTDPLQMWGSNNPASRRQAQQTASPSFGFTPFGHWPSLSSINSVASTHPADVIERHARRTPLALRRPAPTKPEAVANSPYIIYLPAIFRPDPDLSTGIITPEVGGALTSPDGKVQIDFAPQAVSASAISQYRRITPHNLPPSMRLAGPAFELSAYTVENGETIASFPALVTTYVVPNLEFGSERLIALITPTVDIQIHYAEAEVIGLQENRLRLYRLDPTTGAWKAASAIADTENNVVRATVERSGRYALLGWPLLGNGLLFASSLLTTPVTSQTVILDPDHGGGDPSGGHVTSPLAFVADEEAYNLQFAQLVKTKLMTACGINVIMTRDDDSLVSWQTRANLINTSNPDAAITLAFDVVTGVMGNTSTTGTGAAAWIDSSKPLQGTYGLEVTSRVHEFIGLRNRGLKNGTFIPLVVAVSSAITYTHAELAFMDNYSDRLIMDDPVGMDAIANGVVTATVNMLGGAGGTLTCDPTIVRGPLSAEERARLRDLGYKNWLRYGGDPVANTGNHLHQFTDWAVPGLGGFDFVLQRTYNSLDYRDGLFGQSWSSWLDMYLRLASDGSVDVREADGAGVYFEMVGGGFVPGQDGVFDTLAFNGPDYLLKKPDQTAYHFKVFGLDALLMKMEDRYGNKITISRDAAGRITSITDSAGRIYTVTYASDGKHIASITDVLGRTMTYTYDGNGDLRSIEDPNNGIYQFEYDDHRMTNLTDSEGVLYLQNFYEGGSGKVTEQIDASGVHSTITYGNQEITFVDNLGNHTIHRFDNLNRVTETEDDLGQIEYFVYDPDYNVTRYTDKRGNSWDFTYDAQGNLLTVTDPLTNIVSYTYNGDNDLTSITDLGGPNNTPRTTTFVYDGDGNLTDILRPDSTTIHATYDAHGQMITLTDGNSHTTQYFYDAQGNLITVIDPETNTTHYGYDVMGRQISMTDANTHTVGFQYDGNDNITQITDPKGRFITFDYDLNDNLETMTDRRGGVTTYTYDENLKLIAETDPEGHTTGYGYDLMYNRTVMTDALGNATLFRYDDLYRLEEVEDALHGITHFDYDPNGNVIGVTDALTFFTDFVYDELNRLETQTDARLGVTTFEYDAVSRLVKVINPRTAVTEYHYDLLDQLVLVVDALTGEWQISYDDAGNVTSTTDANQHTTTLIYDDADRLVQHIDAGGHSTQFLLDGVGNTVKVTDDLDRETDYLYDKNDNLEIITDTLSGETTMAYDAEDNLVTLTDANHHATHFEYDLDSLLTDLTEAGNQLTGFEYDAAHNLKVYTNAKGNEWLYTYDALNRRVTETDPLTHLTQYQYDALSHLTHVTDANTFTTHYVYDALDRLTDAIQNERPGPANHQTNVTTHYDYDAVGNLTAITDGNGETTDFVYDLLDRLTKETNPLTHVWRYEYDSVGNLIKRTDANSNTTQYIYDVDDLLTQILYPTTHVDFAYDSVHNQTAMTDTLGVTANVFDDLNRLESSTNHLGQQVSYGYDAVGNRTRMTYPDGATLRYEYDATDFVERVVDPTGHAFAVTRDLTHNITHIQYPNATSAEYTIDAAERLTAVTNKQADGGIISAFVYELDAVGNRTRAEGTYAWRNPPQLDYDYTYDPLYRLTRSEDSEGHFTEYAFDAVGNRLRLTTNDDPTLTREIDTVTTEYTYDAANELIASIRFVNPRGNVNPNRQTAQVLRAFVHETSAQSGQHIDEATATDLLTQANTLLTALESGTPPTSSEVTTALDTLSNDVTTARAGGHIDRDGIANSLLVKLNHANDANAETGGEALTTVYDYDFNGNRVRRILPDETTGNDDDWLKTEYAYEFENRLAHVQDFRDPNNGVWHPGDETLLTYDGYGRLFRRLHDPHIDGGGQKWIDYVYDGLDPIVEYEEPNPQYHNYYRGLGRILSMRQNAGGGDPTSDGLMYYFHHDGLGSVSAVTKHEGQSAHTYRYNDYGIILDNNGKAADASTFTDPHNHFAYTGQEWDENTELFHFYAREYEPETGVWLQQDPYRGQLGMPGTMHRYGYVGNNPTTYLDSYGYCGPICIGAVIIIGVAIFLTEPQHHILETTANFFRNESLAKTVATIVFNPLDVVDTVADVEQNGPQPYHALAAILALTPLIPGGAAKKVINKLPLPSGVKDFLLGNGNARYKNSKTDNLPQQEHHFGTNKSKKWTAQLENITNKYKLDLDDPWNKEYLPHLGRHPDAYHEWILDQMKSIDQIAKGDQKKFLELYEERIKKVVREHPEMLRKEYWDQ